MTDAPQPPHHIEVLEQRRCRAMITADRPALEQLVDESVVWIHGSGRAEGKTQLLASIGRDRPYRVLEISDYSVRQAGDAWISTGTIEISLNPPRPSESYFNLFTNVWLDTGEGLRVVHSQSTRCPAPA